MFGNTIIAKISDCENSFPKITHILSYSENDYKVVIMLFLGTWSEDCRHGNGKYYYVNGDTYDGEWHKNLKNGPGTYTDNQTNSQV